MLFVIRTNFDKFFEKVKELRSKFKNGVLCSFSGTAEDVKKALELDLHFGITGCSVREETCHEAIKAMPLEKILLATNSPWCYIADSYYGSKYV